MRILRRILVSFAVLILLLAPVRSQAQQMSAADSANVLLSVAGQLRAEGRTNLANSLLTLIVERWPGSPAAAEATRLRGQIRTVVEERSGKTELLVFTTAYGLVLGAALPAAFDANEPEAYGIGLIVGGPVGYFLGRGITKTRPVSEGQARAVSFGTIWGAWQGFGWTQALNIGEKQVCSGDVCFTEDPNGPTLWKATVLGSVVGFGTGLYLSRKDISAGTASTVSFGGLWGTWFGVATRFLVDENSDSDTGLKYALIGGDIGIVTTALLAPSWHLSRNRARVISIAGVAGGLAGAGLLLIIQPDGDKAIAVPMASSALGLALGAYWSRNYDERSAPRGGQDGGDALLHWNRGLSVGMPEPALRFVQADRRGRQEPALSIPLLKARF